MNPSHKPSLEDRLGSERIGAMDSTMFNIEEEFDQMDQPTTVDFQGVPFPIREGSVVDRIVSEAQMIYKAASLVHQEAIQEGNYHKEKASAILENLYKNNEILLSNFAEIMDYYPDIALKVAKNAPALMALLEAKKGEELSSLTKKYSVH